MHLNNKDRVLKRFLPWVLLLGILGLLFWMLLPNSIIQQDDNHTASQAQASGEDEELADQKSNEIVQVEPEKDTGAAVSSKKNKKSEPEQSGSKEAEPEKSEPEQSRSKEVEPEKSDSKAVDSESADKSLEGSKKETNDQQVQSGFVKSLYHLRGKKDYWIALHNKKYNQVLVSQLADLKKKIYLDTVTGVDILYSDYMSNGSFDPKNSKVLAVTIYTGKATRSYYAVEDKGQLRFYDYDGDAPNFTMDRKPFNYIRVTSPFNMHRKHPITGKVRPHEGVDLKGAYGTGIHVTGNGIVTFAGWQHGYGRVIIVNHGNGYQTRYAHLSKMLVHRGEAVKRGQVIGKLGTSGLSTGPHLHYEVRVNGKPRNPLTVRLPTYHKLSPSDLESLQYHANEYQELIKSLGSKIENNQK